MGIVKNIGEILSSPQMSSMSGASVRKYAREMGRTCTEYCMQFEKKITCTIRSLPKSQARHFTFRFIILQRVEDEEGARATPARIPVPPSHTELVEQTAICNSKLLNIVSRSSSPHRPPFRRAQTNVFPRLLFQYLPSQEWSLPPKSRSLSVSSPLCLASGDGLDCSARSSNNCARSRGLPVSRTDPIVTSSRWRIS